MMYHSCMTTTSTIFKSMNNKQMKITQSGLILLLNHIFYKGLKSKIEEEKWIHINEELSGKYIKNIDYIHNW